MISVLISPYSMWFRSGEAEVGLRITREFFLNTKRGVHTSLFDGPGSKDYIKQCVQSSLSFQHFLCVSASTKALYFQYISNILENVSM